LPQGTLRGGAALLLQYLCDMLVEWELGSFWPHLRHALSDSKPPLLILLDGLDEVALEMRQVVQESLEDFVARYPQHRYLVTSEPYAHEGRPYRFSGFAQAGLAPLDQRQIDLFISGWYLALARHRQLSPAHAAASARRLRAAVSSSGLRVLAESPLLLTMMTLLHMRRGQFPEDRVELYRWMAGLLVRCWEGRRGSAQALHEALGSPDLKISDLEAGLYEVAFRAYGGHGEMKDSGGVSRRDLQEWLVPYLGGSRHHAARFVDTICERPGLLRHSQPEAFTFAHPTFSPFLAACHLAGRAEFPTESARLVRSDPERWRSVYLLAVSHTAHTGRLKSALCAVDALCPSPFLPGVSAVPADWRAASLAGEALLEIGLDEVQRHRLGRAASQRAQGWLAALLRAGAMSPLERARAGDRLAQIGEARFRADAFALPDEPLLGFVEIPSGPFLMGTREEEVPALLAMHGGRREWYQSETPQHRLTLQAFYIARYPVTVAQFRAFVEDSGYRPWGLNGLRSPDNRPMTWVTWHDALQYCEWLTSRLRKWDGTPEPLGSLLRERGCTVALPTEAQWEKAARGTDGRTFPWGDELDATRCNMTGTGISTTCAVGMFPSGRSLYGVDDVSGNVWEWCRTKWRNSYQEPADDSLQGEAARVLRGGAFALEGWLVRCAARSWYLRGLVSRLVGFRIVVAPDLNPHLGQHPQAQ
jgi:formylglycine-generating enzyme required for sulfatase activity